MREFTPEEVARIYVSALDSVELLKRGEPVGYVGDWTPVETANKQHLEIVLAYDCWTTEDLTPLQMAAVSETPKSVQPVSPVFDPNTQKVIEVYPVKHGDIWVQSWNVVDLTPDEQAANAISLQTSIVASTQQRLDDFAKTRGYDGILSACTYATSPTVKFAAEGQYCVAQRDATWAKLYEMLAEVQAGTRPVPSGFDDIKPELPALEWPV